MTKTTNEDRRHGSNRKLERKLSTMKMIFIPADFIVVIRVEGGIWQTCLRMIWRGCDLKTTFVSCVVNISKQVRQGSIGYQRRMDPIVSGKLTKRADGLSKRSFPNPHQAYVESERIL